MNIPGITRALELDDADWDLAVKLRGLTEHQREQFSAALGPVKVQKKSERVIKYCADCDYTKRAKVHRDATAVGYHEFQPATKKPAGKGGGGKSKHASSLESAIKGTTGGVTVPLTGVEAKGSVGQLGVKIEEDGVLSSGGNRCQFKREDGRTCMLLPDHNIHHLTTAREYHYFVSPAAHAATGSTGD